MAKLTISRLERDEALREFLYHLRGIVEATDNVVDLTKTLNRAYERDRETFADTTALLEVQALHHLGYHVKSIRTSLRRLQRKAYGELDAAAAAPPPPRRGKGAANARPKKASHRGCATPSASRTKG